MFTQRRHDSSHALFAKSEVEVFEPQLLWSVKTVNAHRITIFKTQPNNVPSVKIQSFLEYLGCWTGAEQEV